MDKYLTRDSWLNNECEEPSLEEFKPVENDLDLDSLMELSSVEYGLAPDSSLEPTSESYGASLANPFINMNYCNMFAQATDYSQANPSFIEADLTVDSRLRELHNSENIDSFTEPSFLSNFLNIDVEEPDDSFESDVFLQMQNIFQLPDEIASSPDLSADETSNSDIDYDDLLGQSCDPNDVLDRSYVVQDSFQECDIDLLERNNKILSQVHDDHCYSKYSKSTAWVPVPSLPSPSCIVLPEREISESPKNSPDDEDDTPEEKEDAKDLTWQPACSAPKKRRGRPPINRQNKKSPKETKAKVKTPTPAKKYAKHTKTEEERDIHNQKERGRRAQITQNLAAIEARLPVEVMNLCFQAIQNVKSSGTNGPENKLSHKVLYEMRRLKESSYSQQPRGNKACATPRKFSKMTVLLSAVYHIRYNKNVSISKKKEKFNKLTKEKRKCQKLRQESRAQ